MTALEPHTQRPENRAQVPEGPVTGVPEERGEHNGEQARDTGNDKEWHPGGTAWTGGDVEAAGEPVAGGQSGPRQQGRRVRHTRGSVGAGPALGGPCYVLSGETGKGVREAEYVGGGNPGKMRFRNKCPAPT